MVNSTTLTQEAKNQAKNMEELGWGPSVHSGIAEMTGERGSGSAWNSARNSARNADYDNMYLINPPAENNVKPPSGRLHLDLPRQNNEILPQSDSPKISFRGSNPNRFFVLSTFIKKIITISMTISMFIILSSAHENQTHSDFMTVLVVEEQEAIKLALGKVPKTTQKPYNRRRRRLPDPPSRAV